MIDLLARFALRSSLGGGGLRSRPARGALPTGASVGIGGGAFWLVPGVFQHTDT
jgi:hypothetical protein